MLPAGCRDSLSTGLWATRVEGAGRPQPSEPVPPPWLPTAGQLLFSQLLPLDLGRHALSSSHSPVVSPQTLVTDTADPWHLLCYELLGPLQHTPRMRPWLCTGCVLHKSTSRPLLTAKVQTRSSPVLWSLLSWADPGILVTFCLLKNLSQEFIYRTLFHYLLFSILF